MSSGAITFETIDEQYQPTLEYLDVPNPRLMILFSGPESSGKTTLARSIESAFQGIRLENDAIRSILHRQDSSIDLAQNSKITYAYTAYFREKLIALSSNGLWIIDASVDRRYPIYAEFAEKYDFRTMLFAMKISNKILEQRISGREGRKVKSTAEYLSAMPQRRLEQELFLKDHKPDMEINADTTAAEVHAAITKCLGALKAI